MKPNEYYFSNQHTHEKILYVYHRHWFDIFKQYIPLILLVIVLAVTFSLDVLTGFNDENVTTLVNFTQTLLLLIIWVGGFMIWFDYYLDVWIITTQRIVDVQQTGLFSRKVSELRFLQIQDLSTDVQGFIPTFLNYGDVHIQTAAEQSKFIFHSVPNPYKIKADIIALQRKVQQKTFTKKKTCDISELVKGKNSEEDIEAISDEKK